MSDSPLLVRRTSPLGLRTPEVALPFLKDEVLRQYLLNAGEEEIYDYCPFRSYGNAGWTGVDFSATALSDGRILNALIQHNGASAELKVEIHEGSPRLIWRHRDLSSADSDKYTEKIIQLDGEGQSWPVISGLVEFYGFAFAPSETPWNVKEPVAVPLTRESMVSSDLGPDLDYRSIEAAADRAVARRLRSNYKTN